MRRVVAITCDHIDIDLDIDIGISFTLHHTLHTPYGYLSVCMALHSRVECDGRLVPRLRKTDVRMT